MKLDVVKHFTSHVTLLVTRRVELSSNPSHDQRVLGLSDLSIELSKAINSRDSFVQRWRATTFESV
jgi:hypothetical protein